MQFQLHTNTQTYCKRSKCTALLKSDRVPTFLLRTIHIVYSSRNCGLIHVILLVIWVKVPKNYHFDGLEHALSSSCCICTSTICSTSNVIFVGRPQPGRRAIFPVSLYFQKPTKTAGGDCQPSSFNRDTIVVHL